MKRALLFAAAAALASVALASPPDIESEAVLLVAQKPLDGGPFHRAVAVAAPMSGGGHFGVVLNKPLKITLARIFPDHAPAKAVRGPMRFGGLFQNRAVMAMVRAEEAPAPRPKALPVMPGIWLVLDEEPLDRVILEKPNESRFYVGMIVWEDGLLREQIDAGRLAVLKADASLLFLEDTSRLHAELSRRLDEAKNVKQIRY